MKRYTSLTESWAQEVGILDILESTPDDEKLKKVLDLAKQTISVIFPDQMFVVKWADGKTRSSLVSNIITLNPDPLLNPKVSNSFLERVDIVIGEAILSAGHRKSAILSAELMLRLWGRNKLKESIAFQIWSAAELNYSESEIIKNYPGYAGYFDAYRRYYLTEGKRQAIQNTIDATKIKTNLKVCVSAIVWELLCDRDELDLKDYLTPVIDSLRHFDKENMSCFDRAYAASRVTNWLLDYYGEWDEYEKSLEKAAEEERHEAAKKQKEKDSAEDEEESDEGDPSDEKGEESGENEESDEGDPSDQEGSGNSEKDGNESDEGSGKGKSLEELIDECPMAEDLGVSKLIKQSKEVSQEDIDSSNAKEGDNYIDDFDFSEEELGKETEEKVNSRDTVSTNPKIKEIDHAREATPTDKDIYQRDLVRVRSFIPQVLNSLKFRNEEQKLREFGLKRGNVDPGALSKLSYDDYNVFEREEIISKPKVHITLLVDESGSMNYGVTTSCPVCGTRSCNHMGAHSANDGTRASIARITAILLGNAIKQIDGVDLSVYGHSSESNKCAFYRYYDQTNKKLECLGKISARNENYDGYAVEHAGKLTLRQAEQTSYKLMIIISDGQPSAPGYGGKEGMKHVRKVVQKLHSQGVNTLAIGIGVPEEEIAYMYGTGYLCINVVSELPAKLARIVSQIIRKQS